VWSLIAALLTEFLVIPAGSPRAGWPAVAISYKKPRSLNQM
jgi:hypothetical protein